MPTQSNDKPRKQLSLRFDNYIELLEEAESFCKANRITMTALVVTGLRLAMTSQEHKPDTDTDKTSLVNLQSQIDELRESLVDVSQRLANIEEHKAKRDRPSAIDKAQDKPVTADDKPNKCIGCGYISGKPFTREGHAKGKQRWKCPQCEMRSVNHIFSTESKTIEIL